MAGIASHLLEFPTEGPLSPAQYDDRIRKFVDSITKLDDAKVAKADLQQDFLPLLNPSTNSISYIYTLRLRLRSILRAHIPSQDEAQRTLLQAFGLMSQFDSVQVRYYGEVLRDTIDYTVTLASSLHMLDQVIVPLVAAILRIDPTSGTLTSTHLKLFRLCLQTRRLREALPILESTIHSFPASKSLEIDGRYLCSPHADSSSTWMTEFSGISEKLTNADVHEYFVLGGQILIGLQRWADAKLYFECVLLSPTQGTPSALQVEAYRKWVLVVCIMKGHIPDPPKGIHQNTMRTIQTVAKAYDNLVQVFVSGNLQRLQSEVAAGQTFWTDDGNLGLVQTLVARMPRFHILNMQDTYSAVPLTSVSNWLGMNVNTLHTFIEGMVTEGALNADIDLGGAEPVLRFYSNQSKGPLAKTEKQYNAELIAQTRRTNAMAEYVKMSDRRLTLTKEYIEAMRKRAKNKDADNGMAPTGEPLDDPAQLEEDIMMDD